MILLDFFSILLSLFLFCFPSREISFHRPVTVSMTTSACHRQTNEVSYLEHVILRVTLTHPRRGDLQIFLTSPSGTVSNILERRQENKNPFFDFLKNSLPLDGAFELFLIFFLRDFDRSKMGFREWEFMTTHHWGENPMGVWQLEIRDLPKSLRYRLVNKNDFTKTDKTLLTSRFRFLGVYVAKLLLVSVLFYIVIIVFSQPLQDTNAK